MINAKTLSTFKYNHRHKGPYMCTGFPYSYGTKGVEHCHEMWIMKCGYQTVANWMQLLPMLFVASYSFTKTRPNAYATYHLVAFFVKQSLLYFSNIIFCWKGCILLLLLRILVSASHHFKNTYILHCVCSTALDLLSQVLWLVKFLQYKSWNFIPLSRAIINDF